MKMLVISALGTLLIISGPAASAQKIIGPDRPAGAVSATQGQKVANPAAALSATQGQKVSNPAAAVSATQGQRVAAGVGGGPHTAMSLTGALAASGKFGTFLSILKAAGWDGDGKAGFADGSVRGVTVLAPDDGAFAAMDKERLEQLMNDKAAARAFVMAHVVAQPLKVTDLFYAENPTSVKLFQSAKGDPLKLLCDGRAHVGLHHPRINDGMAKVGDVQDVRFNDGMIQEIDGLLAK